jgi:hypothetical protein
METKARRLFLATDNNIAMLSVFSVPIYSTISIITMALSSALRAAALARTYLQ